MTFIDHDTFNVLNGSRLGKAALLFAPDEDIFKMPSTEEEEETTEQSADDLIAAALAITQAAANETTVEQQPAIREYST